MKYGQTLQQRSIPEWGPYNVDYNEIKQLIKARTTRDKAHAISIPGCGQDTASEAFENELFTELCEQHERIDLFVFSKCGEISRRLNHLHKQVLQLSGVPKSAGRTRMSVRRLEKFSKYEEEVLKAGEEIQSLSRFVGAQRLAFQKLLKKYKRWTGKSGLGKRFAKEILDQPTGFFLTDFESLVGEWATVLSAVREPFGDGITAGSDQEDRRASSSIYSSKPKRSPPTTESGSNIPRGPSAGQQSRNPGVTQIQSASENGTDVDLDTALATLPLGYPAGKATYWVHPDNLVELQVVLLQHMRVRRPKKQAQVFSSNLPSPALSRASSFAKRSASTADDRGDEAGITIFDDLERFVEGWSSMPISEFEHRAGPASEKAAVSVRWTAEGDATVVARTTPLDTPELEDSMGALARKVRVAKLKRKNIRRLFDENLQHSIQRRESDVSAQSTEGISITDLSTSDLDEIRDWLSRHDEIQPLVQIRSRRTRFLGVKNSFSQGAWAILDRDIKMEKACLETIGKPGPSLSSSIEWADGNQASITDGDSIEFPFAVLEIRWEGEDEANLVQALDNSHLTERVRGFSTETHAVAVLYKPKGMSPPLWLSALEKDIRKLPMSSDASRRTSHPGISSSGTNNTSVSATSTTGGRGSTPSEFLQESSATSVPDLLESPPLSSFKKKRRREFQEHPLRNQANNYGLASGERYWNEYDDGDEAQGDEPYTIFIDPDNSTTFPGLESLSRIITTVATGITRSAEKIQSWLSPGAKNGEEQPMLREHNTMHSTIDDTDAEYASSIEHNIHASRHYSTFAEHQEQATVLKEHFLLRAYVACFSASVIVLAMVSVLAVTGRHRLRVPVDLGVIFGVFASLAFAVAGMGMMLVRRTSIGRAHRFFVLVTFGIVCIASGVLLALVGTGG